jgi:hypothetical protein
MKKRDSERILKKSFAIFSIYLILSLTFFTAKALAVLNYQISGDQNLQNYARRGTGDNVDVIKLHVEANSNVSFVTNSGEIPVRGCINTSGKMICDQLFEPGEINTNIRNLSFTLRQVQGSPTQVNGYLYIDGNAPRGEVNASKTNTGMNFTYNFAEPDCRESGIGYFEIDIEGRPSVLTRDITTRNCSVAGSVAVDLTSETYIETIRYYAKVMDRVGNEYSTAIKNLSGDFKAPVITRDFKIMRSNIELTDFSSVAEVTADILIEVEDSQRPTVYGDLLSVNNNPALRVLYKKYPATCNLKSDNLFECKFAGVRFKPSSTSLSINVTAEDIDKNVANETISKTITLHNNAGGVLYVGPLKSQCTEDLTRCYMKSGAQLLFAEIDATSSFEHSPIGIGVDNKVTYAFCNFGEVWTCIGSFIVPQGTVGLNLFIAQSQDDYGNLLRSDMKRTVIIDNTPPVRTRELTVSNNNQNNNCSVSGDELTLNVRVSDESAGLKMYVNTSGFTSQDIQNGVCVLTAGGEWDCTIVIKDFSSAPALPLTTRDIVIEDLAGNRMQNLKYAFNVCKTSSSGIPNYISNARQLSTPNIDRRTASLLPVKVFIPLTFDLKSGASIAYLNVERCMLRDMNNMDVIGSEKYFVPSSPNNGKDSSIVLTVGHSDAMLPEGDLWINCTISARMQYGQTVYLREEKEIVLLKVSTFNQPLGTLDNATQDIINLQKEELRSLSDRIDKRVTNEKALEFICKVSNILIKIDSLLQTIKAGLYVVAVILYVIPLTSAWGEKLWEIINSVTSTVDRFVQKNVWPTGDRDVTGKSMGKPWGYLWKYTCMYYSCQFYTLSGWVDVISDAINGIKALSSEKTGLNYKKSTCDTKPPPCINVYKDGSQEEITEKDGKKTTVRTDKNGNKETTVKDSTGSTVTKTTGTGADKKETVMKYNPDGTPIDAVSSSDSERQATYLFLESTPTADVPDYDENGVAHVADESITGIATPVPVPTKITEKTTYALNEKTGDLEGHYVMQETDTFGHIYAKDEYTIAIDKSSASFKISGITVPFGGGTSTTIRRGDNLVSQILVDTYGEKTTIKPDSTKKTGFSRTVENEQYFTLRDQSYLTTGHNALLYNSIDNHDWIINPYRSRHYDGLCGRAITYNLKKERQIRCMYVSCLKDSMSSGMPSSICNDIYRVNNCLYLDSAQYVLSPNTGTVLTQGLVKQTIMFTFGYSTQKLYELACNKYIDKLPAEDMKDRPLSKGSILSVLCGSVGALLKWQEIKALFKSPQEVFKNLLKGDAPEDPAQAYDYCLGGEVYAE